MRTVPLVYNRPKEHPRDTLSFIHITDTHILDNAGESFYALNTRKSLQAVLSSCITRYPDIDFWLFTGDISQTGKPESYSLFCSIIKDYDVPVYCVPGNHDSPEHLQRVIPDCPVNSVHIIQLGRFSLVLLDSWVLNEHHGRISCQNLRQLEDYLQQNCNLFNIIVLHHPPVPVGSQWLDDIGLQNSTEFLQVLSGHPEDTLVLFGHVHQEVDLQSGRLRLLSTPSTCHQFKPLSQAYCPDTLPPAYRFVKLGWGDALDTQVHYVNEARGQG